MTSCDLPAGIGASLRTDKQTNERTDGWTDRRDVGNSILDCKMHLFYIFVKMLDKTMNIGKKNFYDCLFSKGQVFMISR